MQQPMTLDLLLFLVSCAYALRALLGWLSLLLFRLPYVHFWPSAMIINLLNIVANQTVFRVHLWRLKSSNPFNPGKLAPQKRLLGFLV